MYYSYKRGIYMFFHIISYQFFITSCCMSFYLMFQKKCKTLSLYLCLFVQLLLTKGQRMYKQCVLTLCFCPPTCYFSKVLVGESNNMTKTNMNNNYLPTICHSHSRIGPVTHFTAGSIAQLIVRLISFVPLWVSEKGFEQHARSTLRTMANLWPFLFIFREGLLLIQLQ